jgi:hypothetical protein
MTTCVDLRALAGDRFRVAHDPAYHAEHGDRGRTDDPWLLTIPCRFGHFFPWGGNRLAFSTNTRGGTAKVLTSLPFVQMEQDAEDGYTLTFAVGHFDEVAQLAKPKRRRRLTSDHRQALVAAGKAALQRHREANSKSPNLASKSTRRLGADTSVAQLVEG